MSVTVRAAHAGDADALARIYNYYIEHSHVTFDVEPKHADERRTWIAGFDGARHFCLVAEEDGAVLGFATSQAFRPKHAYRPSVETSVYLDPDQCGRGHGRTLYAALLDRLGRADVHRAYGLVALPNDASLALHERFGFTEAGRLGEVGLKFGRYWDVAYMEKPLR